MKGLDLRKFVKIKSDAKKTVLKHPDGHSIHIARGSLSPKMQKDLDALPFADGGIVPEYARAMEAGATGKKAEPKKDDSSPGVTSSAPVSRPSPDPDQARADSVERQKAAFNSQMGRPMNSGGMTSSDQDSPEQIIADLPAPGEQPQAQALGADPGRYAGAYDDRMKFNHDNTPGLPEQAMQTDALNEAERQKNIDDYRASNAAAASRAEAARVTSDNARKAALGIAPLPVPPIAVPPGAPSEDSPQTSQSIQGPSPASSPPAAMPQAPTPQSAISQGMQSEMAGLQHKFEAETAAGQGKVTALEQAQKQQADAALKFDTRMADLTKERQAVLADKIDPEHFWSSKSTGSQISTILGMLVSGLGGNDTTKWLNQQIDRDMDAQKTNKSNVLHGLEQQFQDTKAAADFHRVLLNDQVSQGLQLAEAKAATPMARANMEMARGQLQKQNGMLMVQIGAQQTMNSGKSSQADVEHAINTLRMVDPAKAKEAEQRMVPGVGVASVPVNDKTREAFSSGQTFIQQMDQLEKFRQAHRGAMFGAAADEGHRLAELARNSFRIAQGEGVFKAGSQQFNEKLIADPTSLDVFGKNKVGYADMKNQAMREMQNAAKVHGIKPFENSVLIPQQDQYIDFARKNPNLPASKAILQRFGSK